MYKVGKDQVSVFGFRTQFGGGKSTGFALLYDSQAAMKKFEPRYRLIRVGMATKPERASRQQRKLDCLDCCVETFQTNSCRETTKEPTEGVARNHEGQGREQGQEEEVIVWTMACVCEYVWWWKWMFRG